MRLDTALLPKPFQLSALTSRDCSSSRPGSASRARAQQLPAPVETASPGRTQMKLLLIVGGAVAAVGLFLLATASGDTALFARALPAAARPERGARRAARRRSSATSSSSLARRYRARVFGARLTLRLLARFAAARRGAGPARLCRLGAVPDALDRVLVRREGRCGAGGRHQPRPAGDRPDDCSTCRRKARAHGARARRPLAGRSSRRARAPARAGRASRRRWWSPRAGAWWPARAQDVTQAGAGAAEPARCCARRAPAAATPRSMRTPGRPLSLRVIVPVDALRLADEARFLQLRQSVPPIVRPQRRGGRSGLPRLPGAGALARRAEADLHRDADASRC